VEPIAARVRSDAEIEKVMISLGHEPRGGLVDAASNVLTQVRAGNIRAYAVA
jgi:hypothetical protein